MCAVFQFLTPHTAQHEKHVFVVFPLLPLNPPTEQAMEVFPTSVRQSGIGFCSFISQMISIGGPYAMAAGAVNVMVG